MPQHDKSAQSSDNPIYYHGAGYFAHAIPTVTLP